MRSNPIDLKAGTEYDIKLVPFQHIATDQVRKFHWERRDCFFPDEQACCIVTHIQFCIQLKKPKFQEEDSMFKTYSLKGCQFECKLTNTFKSDDTLHFSVPNVITSAGTMTVSLQAHFETLSCDSFVHVLMELSVSQ